MYVYICMYIYIYLFIYVCMFTHFINILNGMLAIIAVSFFHSVALPGHAAVRSGPVDRELPPCSPWFTLLSA